MYIGGVPAYSTLGWFDDPVLSSFVSWPETEVARLIFHELAHQLIYVKSDSAFNESYRDGGRGGRARALARRAARYAAREARGTRGHMRTIFRDLLRPRRRRLS